jgi:hypothetical protein
MAELKCGKVTLSSEALENVKSFSDFQELVKGKNIYPHDAKEFYNSNVKPFIAKHCKVVEKVEKPKAK